MKLCNFCKIKKPKNKFSKKEASKDGLQLYCKACMLERKRTYRKTKKGLISEIFENQVANSKARGHTKPQYTKKELSEWVFNNNFNNIFEAWEVSGHIKDLKPSVDRLDDFKPYALENIQLITWGENIRKFAKDRFNATGKAALGCKEVTKFTLAGDFIKNYKSIAIASRDNKTHHQNIVKCCQGKRQKAGGFKWKYLSGN